MAIRFVDTAITYRILRMLITPFVNTDAYKLGIIDAKGKELKKMSQLHTVKERDAYTLLHRLVFRIKRIIEKVPVENKKLLSFAAALALVKEHLENNNEPINLEHQFIESLGKDFKKEQVIIESFLNKKTLVPFGAFYEDAPVNNAAATPGIDGMSPDSIGVRKRKLKIIKRRTITNA